MSFLKKFKKLGKFGVLQAINPIAGTAYLAKQTGVSKLAHQALGVMKPFAGTVALVIPGGSAAVAGVYAADKLLQSYNSPHPAKQQAAARVVRATKILAAKGNVAATNGLNMMNKRAAALREARKHRIDSKGVIHRLAG